MNHPQYPYCPICGKPVVNRGIQKDDLACGAEDNLNPHSFQQWYADFYVLDFKSNGTNFRLHSQSILSQTSWWISTAPRTLRDKDVLLPESLHGWDVSLRDGQVKYYERVQKTKVMK